jgi:hypothetical protein
MAFSGGIRRSFHGERFSRRSSGTRTALRANPPKEKIMWKFNKVHVPSSDSRLNESDGPANALATLRESELKLVAGAGIGKLDPLSPPPAQA